MCLCKTEIFFPNFWYKHLARASIAIVHWDSRAVDPRITELQNCRITESLNILSWKGSWSPTPALHRTPKNHTISLSMLSKPSGPIYETNLHVCNSVAHWRRAMDYASTCQFVKFPQPSPPPMPSGRCGWSCWRHWKSLNCFGAAWFLAI